MKKRSVLVAIAVVIALVFALAVPVAAANETKSIEVTNREIKIVVDGVLIKPADANGNAVEPFIYAGTIFLPIRAVAGVLGLSADWNEETSTVNLTSGAEVNTGTGTPVGTNATRNIEITYRDIVIAIDGTEITPTDAAGNPVEPFIFEGTTYLPVRTVASALGVEVGWDEDTSTVYLGEQPTKTYWLVSKVTDYTTDSSILYEDTYTYDEYGRNTSVVTHYPDDPGSDYTVTRTYEGWNVIFEDYGDGYSRYTYDENGKMISNKYYYGGAMTEWRYGYDAGGKHISTTRLYNGTIFYTAVITYDSRENLVRCVTEYPDYTAEETKSYEYDASGYLVGESYNYSDGSYEYGQYYMYLYDDSGKLTTEFQYWIEDGEKKYYDTNLYSYDENGNLVRLDYDGGYTTYSYVSFKA